MSLGFERHELGNDFIFSISEEVGVIHKTTAQIRGTADCMDWSRLLRRGRKY